MNKNKGFTLIELLIVMAILGVLAVVVLVAINPVQQLARTRDAGRKSGVGQIGRSLEAYYTSHGGVYIPESATWVSTLVTAGEVSTVPAKIGNSLTTECAVNNHSGWCYDANAASNGTGAIMFTALESDSEKSKCTAGTAAWFVWSTVDGRGGLICTGNYSTPPTFNSAGQTFNTVQ
ncbi:MAG TPA: prepilin-type N-terminal cleavage/methylation domain-containing protein [Patescibacteria group bacterium]|nr:prepilin-type N-terminal cleavage/methylation domain-containing protein [Patescibacteria group bacterium]